MDKLDGIIDRAFGLVERLIIPIILVLGFFFYLKFSSFFGNKDKEQKEREAAKAEHEDALTLSEKVAPPGASAAEKKRIAIENGEKAKVWKQALNAERINSATSFGINFHRTDDLFDAARKMKEHKVSLAGTAEQFRKLTGDNMYTTVRTALGDDDYVRWKIIAGSTP